MKCKPAIYVPYILLLLVCSCAAQQLPGTELNYPVIEQHKKSAVFFGREVIDEYANIEQLDHPEIRSWLKAQDSIAEDYFSSNDLFNVYREHFRNLESKAEGSVSMVRMSEAGHYFYLKYDDTAGVDKLFFRPTLEDSEIELFDPSSYGRITYMKPSWGGEYIAVGFDAGDGFSSKIYIIDVATGEMLKEVITNINPDFGGIEWLPDGSGFIYLYFPIVDQNLSGHKKDSYSVLHKLQENTDKRTPIFGKSENLDIPSNFYPKVKIGSDENSYAIGYVANSNDFYEAYIARISDLAEGKAKWLPFFSEDDKVYYDQGEVRGDDFIFRQGCIEGNRLAITNIKEPDFDNPHVLAVGVKESPISKFAVTRDKIYYTTTKFGVEVSLFVINPFQGTEEVSLPFTPGYLSFIGESLKTNQLIVGVDGWTSDYTRYIINEEEVYKEALLKEKNIPQFQNLVSKQILVTSHDGEEVPLSLVYREDISMDSDNEVFLYVYGAYGESMSPFYSPIFLDWANRGGILAFPHVRGGGEKGKEWHTAGMKNMKHNSWKDLNACVDALIQMGFTRKGLIALYTSSAGGITGGMAVNERPDLYSSFIAEVPRLNPFGLESSSTASSTSYLEYGSIKDSVEFHGLLKMDPYLNIKDGAEYPATLVLPSYNDDRIPLWDSAKYIAKLQRANAADTPVLLDIDYQSGHDSNGGTDDVIRLYSKIFSFARANMN